MKFNFTSEWYNAVSEIESGDVTVGAGIFAMHPEFDESIMKQGESRTANYTIKNGDALSPETGIIVHGCNCQFVMGAGIAFQVAKRFPAAYDVYMKQRESGGLKLGEITFAEVAPLKYIVNANTQFSCGGDKRYVDYEAIAKCFEKVKAMAEVIEGVTGVKLDIVFPMIGAGLAGGNWKIIETIILETIGDEFNKVLYKFP